MVAVDICKWKFIVRAVIICNTWSFHFPAVDKICMTFLKQQTFEVSKCLHVIRDIKSQWPYASYSVETIAEKIIVLLNVHRWTDVKINAENKSH